MKAHNVVFSNQPELLDSGVYSWVRHPMYLGTLLVCLGFLLAIPSILALMIWLAFFLIYNKMATYEENDVVRDGSFTRVRQLVRDIELADRKLSPKRYQ